MPDDRDLLRRLSAGDRAALDHIAARHLDFVYATALRAVGDLQTAADVSQAVFVILVAKARRLSADVILVGWLYRTTHHVASNALRARRRRAFHETRAAGQRAEATMHNTPADAETLRQLDAAMLSLRSKSRDALLLRFFRHQSMAEVSITLGISEEAAKKRVSRAVDELRATMTASSGSDASTLALLGAIPNVSAPATLTTSVLHPTSAASTLAKGTLLIMTAKQTSIVVGIVILLLLGTGAVITLNSLGSGSASPSSPDGNMTDVAALAPPPLIVQPGLKARFDGGEIEVLGSGDPLKADGWLNAAGDGTKRPWDEFGGKISPEPGKTARAFAYLTAWDDSANAPSLSVSVDNSNGSVSGTTRISGNTSDNAPRAIIVNLPDTQTLATVRFQLATGSWKTIATFTPSMTETTVGGDSTMSVKPIRATKRGTEAVIAMQASSGDDQRWIFVERNGKEHVANSRADNPIDDAGGGSHREVTVGANDLKPEDVGTIRLESRPFDQWVEFSGLPVIAGTKPMPGVRMGH